MNTSKALRIGGLVLSIVGGAISVALTLIDDKKETVKINEAVEKAMAAYQQGES